MARISVNMLLALGVILSCTLVSTYALNEPCLYDAKGYIWNLGALRNETGFHRIEDPILPGNSIDFNFCKQVKCGDKEAYGVMNRPGSCSPLTDDINNPIESIIGNQSLSLLFNYTGEEKCFGDPRKKYTFELRLICSEKEEDFVWVRDALNPCRIVIEKKTDSGCPILKAGGLWSFFDTYKYFLPPFLVAIGLFLMLFGAKFIKATMFVFIFITTFIVSFFLIYLFFVPLDASNWTIILVVAICLLISLIAAYFTTACMNVGAFLVGFWLGALIATLLFETIIYRITAEPVVLYIMVIIFGIIAGILAVKFLEMAMIIATSFIGAYLLVKGLSIYIGGYPSVLTIMKEIQAGDIDNVPASVYIYVLVTIGFTVLGVLFQLYGLDMFSKRGEKYQQFE